MATGGEAVTDGGSTYGGAMAAQGAGIGIHAVCRVGFRAMAHSRLVSGQLDAYPARGCALHFCGAPRLPGTRRMPGARCRAGILANPRSPRYREQSHELF